MIYHHKILIFVLLIVMIEIIASKTQQNYNEYTRTKSASYYDPRLRQFNTQENTLNDNYNPVVPAPNATQNFLNHAAYLNNNRDNNYHRPIYALPRRSSPPDIAKYRNEGNFYQAQRPQHAELQRKRNSETFLKESQLLQPPAVFEQEILHVEPAPKLYADYRSRRYTDVNIPDSLRKDYNKSESSSRNREATASSEADHVSVDNDESSERSIHDHLEELHQQKDHSLMLPKETRYFHDLYMRYAGPQQLSFGHVESRPKLFQKRFESLNKGNRYKGEVIWADQTGGYGEHHWDMAQGKLR